MTDLMLPPDLFKPSEGQDAAQTWRSLEGQTADALAKRTDLIGVLALEEQAAGEQGWRERVQNRLSQGDLEPVGRKVIGDMSKVFTLFRLGGDRGLGWTREQVAQQGPGKLRAFAQNAEWCLRNRDQVEALIESGVNENKVREAIREAKRREAGENSDEPKEVWETIQLRVDPVQARVIRDVLAAVRVKAQQLDGEAFSDNAKVADGQAAFKLATVWAQGYEVMDDGFGGDVTIENASFMDAEVVAAINESLAEGDHVEAEGNEEAA